MRGAHAPGKSAFRDERVDDLRHTAAKTARSIIAIPGRLAWSSGVPLNWCLCQAAPAGRLPTSAQALLSGHGGSRHDRRSTRGHPTRPSSFPEPL